MKKAKAFLARVLTAAVMITSLLPSSVVTVNAASIQNVEEGWKVQKQASDWSNDFDDFLNLGGIQTWHLESELSDGNVHGNLSDSNAPAVVYAEDIDITAADDNSDNPRIISFDMLPVHKEGETGSTASNMRFGVFLKYVDPTHWVFLGNEVTVNGENHWWLEYNTGASTGYPDITEFANFALEDDIFHHVEIKYVSSSEIEVSLAKMVETDGVWAVNEDTKVTATLDNASLLEIKQYAISSQSPEGEPKPIHFGFKAGTYQTTTTDIDIANVMTNANKTGTMQSLRYAYCGWTAVKEGKNARNILSPSSKGGVNYVSVDASESDAAKTVTYMNEVMDDFGEGSVSAVLRPYDEVDDKTVEQAFYLNAKAATSQSPEALQGVQVGFNGQKWGYKINGGQFVEASTQAAAPQAKHDYKVDISFTKDNKFNAKIIEVSPTGDEDEVNGGDAYLKGDFSEVVGTEILKIENQELPADFQKTGTISITADAGLHLRLRNVNYSKTTYQDAIEYLGAAYTTVMNRNNDNNTFYTEPWETFTAARTAANEELEADNVITAQGATDLLEKMTDAWTVLNVDENKTATGKTALEEAKADLAAKGDKDYYSYDETAYTEAKNAVDTAYTKISNPQTAVTKAEVTAALGLWENLVFTPVTATDEDKAQIGNAVKDAENKIVAADAAFYDNYEAYESALNALKALQNKENVSKKEITDAIEELQDAMANCKLTAADQSDKDAAKTSIASIKADVEKNLQPDAAYNAALKNAEDLANSTGEVTKKALSDALKALEAAKGKLPKKGSTDITKPKLSNGQKGTFNNNDYTVVDAQKKTVALTTWNGDKKKLKKVTIPTQVTINGETCTVVSVSTNAFKGYKNLQTLTFGTTIESVAKGAVSGSKKLKTVTFKNANTKVAKAAFKNVTKKVTVKVPKSVKKNSKAKTKFGKMIKKGGIKKYTIK